MGTTKEKVLSLLEQAGQNGVSGQQLAQQLAVSRTAVWKAIACLKEEGCQIEAAPNRGYRLCAKQPTYCAANVRRLRRVDAPVKEYDAVDSTNTAAKELAQSGAPHGTAVFAHHQTAGMGRRGRSFFSPEGGVYLSVILRGLPGMESAAMLTAAAAVAVCRAVQKVYGTQLFVKWVNDLYNAEYKKCGGILTQAAVDLEGGGLEYAIVGVGLNVAPPPQGFPQELTAIAGAILQEPHPQHMSELTACLADEISGMTEWLSDAEWLEEYRTRNFLLGKEIWIERGGQRTPAKAQRILDDARLLVKTPQGEETLNFEEVSVRL